MATTNGGSLRRLVIVESPAKAKTIQGYLGSGYTVDSSVGHIRDLAKKDELPDDVRKEPWARYSVDIDDGYVAYYVVHGSKKKKVSELKAALKKADELILATDEDREGEAIAWHLLEVLQPKVPVRRMVFNEITKDAIQRAAENTRDLDMDLVDAQEGRRIIDRLYGWDVSEVLWRKIGANAKSAGRVQSVAVRLVVDRERERIAFRAADYADIRGVFDPERFAARLVSVNGQRVAEGKDFDDRGRLTAEGALHLDEAAAVALAESLASAAFTVTSVQEKPGTRNPKAPFITSTLQQAASSRMGWDSKKTMRVAQGLYERGHITYMRTDSTSLSAQAVAAAKRQVAELYGPDYVYDSVRTFKGKVKNAQEAHEAIRPAGDSFRTPAQMAGELQGDDYRLYELIWQRTVASQMAPARTSATTIRMAATAADGRAVEFTATGTVILFPGFLAAYDIGSDDDKGDDDEDGGRLPALSEGDTVTPLELTALPHATKPKARFTEASLIRELEERGIGRPSTYASIMTTIIDRGYVYKKGSALVPSWTAFAVTRLMEEHFESLVDYRFTARMEERLDLVSNGEAARNEVLDAFYRGIGSNTGFPGLLTLLSEATDIDPRALSAFPIDGSDAILRVGRYGPYLDRDGARANVPDDLPPDELTPAKVEELFAQPSGVRELGTDPETGRAILAKSGRFGPYVTEVLGDDVPTKGKKAVKPRTASLLASMNLDTVTLDDALRLLSLPRVVGVDPADGGEVVAQNGRYGPYLTKTTGEAKDTRSLETEEQIFTVTLDEALALFAQPKRRGQRAAAAPLMELGPDPVSGGMITLREGRFGPYVTDGSGVNASLRSGDDPLTLTPARAIELLAERRERAPVKRAKKAPAKKAAKKTTRKKTTTKKATAKKAVVEA